jgi:transcriptional regulator with XRE-family HTH domain
VAGVTASDEIRDFLTSRRARITPEQAGLPAYGTHRRVAGLRREEVALLAGISVEYYTKLERGNATGISESVLEGLVRALQLDEAERTHLYNLFRAAGGSAPRRQVARRPSRTVVRRPLQLILDTMTGTPAYVRNGRMDILAANDLGRALYSPVFSMGDRIPNTSRFIFLDPTAPDFFLDWDRVESDAVAILRAAAGRDPYDKQLTDLVGELSTRSERFRVLWARHDVKLHHTGTKRLHHPTVGDLTLSYEAFELPVDTGQQINVYTAEPDSADAERLALLASWAATTAPALAHQTRRE